jgi:paired amphipathic helix protein Sin3a
MVVENNAATIRVLEPFAQKLSTLTSEQAARLKLGDALDILHIRSIIRLYGEQGYDVIELLKRSPATAIPVILMRLKQKDEEWRRVRVEMKNQWRKVNEANYQRSLDHRSFYFKQEDKKRRAPKGD